MQELINTLTRRKSGLYDLNITTADGKQVLNVGTITMKQAIRLIEEQEGKSDKGRRER